MTENAHSRTSESAPVPDTARLADGCSPLERAAHVPLPFFATEPPHSPRTPLHTLRSVIPLFPVFQYFYHMYIGTLIEEGLLGDTIMQLRIQIQCLFVLLSSMQSDLGIVVLARLLLCKLQQARADALAAPIAQHGERIDIPFIVLRLLFEPAANGGVEPCFISTPKLKTNPSTAELPSATWMF